MLTTLIPLGNLGHFSGLSRLLLLRCGLLVYSVMISMWSLMVSCNLDTLVWSLVITCINTIWCLHSLYVIYTSKESYQQKTWFFEIFKQGYLVKGWSLKFLFFYFLKPCYSLFNTFWFSIPYTIKINSIGNPGEFTFVV